MDALTVDTPGGPARVHVEAAAGAPRALLVLGHGAGGGVTAPDLQATRCLALADGLSVALVEQPYRVAGRRSPPPAPKLDTAWEAVVGHLAGDLPLVVGGRSSGARVACRTAAATGAAAVLCLAFPLVTPRGVSREPELDAVTVPTLVVQGERDRFGLPPAAPRRTVAVVRGDHALRSDLDALTTAVREWLAGSPWAPSTARARR